MARLRSDRADRPGALQLTVAVDVLASQLDDRVVRGEQLLQREIGSPESLKSVRNDYYSWDEYNHTLLKRSFTTSEPADDYTGMVFGFGGQTSLQQEVNDLRDDIQRKVRKLTSIREQIPLYGLDSSSLGRSVGIGDETKKRNAAFIVHGHNQGFKEQVARFVEAATELMPIILHEQANSGRTIIEKFEDHADAAAFALVLLTGDDEGGVRGSENHLPRARQNVVFELGFFIGILGRSRVAVLYEEGVELPSDMSGVLYTSLDAGGAWKLALAKELRAADLDVDLNRVV